MTATGKDLDDASIATWTNDFKSKHPMRSSVVYEEFENACEGNFCTNVVSADPSTSVVLAGTVGNCSDNWGKQGLGGSGSLGTAVDVTLSPEYQRLLDENQLMEQLINVVTKHWLAPDIGNVWVGRVVLKYRR